MTARSFRALVGDAARLKLSPRDAIAAVVRASRDDWSPEAREAAAKARQGGASGTQHSKVPFVHHLVETHGSHAAIQKHIETQPRAKLNTAATLLEKHGDMTNRHDRGIYKMITKHLDETAGRGF